MSDDRKLPDTQEQPRPREPYLNDVDTHLLEVTQHDKNDVILGRQHLVLFLEDANDGRFVTSNVSSPITTENEHL
jgi:hypothetical protein